MKPRKASYRMLALVFLLAGLFICAGSFPFGVLGATNQTQIIQLNPAWNLERRRSVRCSIELRIR